MIKPQKVERNVQLMLANTGCTRLVTDYYVPPLKIVAKRNPIKLGYFFVA
jgi:hypothetical protein